MNPITTRLFCKALQHQGKLVGKSVARFAARKFAQGCAKLHKAAQSCKVSTVFDEAIEHAGRPATGLTLSVAGYHSHEKDVFVTNSADDSARYPQDATPKPHCRADACKCARVHSVVEWWRLRHDTTG